MCMCVSVWIEKYLCGATASRQRRSRHPSLAPVTGIGRFFGTRFSRTRFLETRFLKTRFFGTRILDTRHLEAQLLRVDFWGREFSGLDFWRLDSSRLDSSRLGSWPYILNPQIPLLIRKYQHINFAVRQSSCILKTWVSFTKETYLENMGLFYKRDLCLALTTPYMCHGPSAPSQSLKCVGLHSRRGSGLGCLIPYYLTVFLLGSMGFLLLNHNIHLKAD